ncbi:hypothetical protein [Streptomyces sp. NPDC048639]|uniref:hypothetical protein n=1 Tax=Streptomyces sp. NPDC048639 TaxID=3365581 RepID=UPI003715E78E
MSDTPRPGSTRLSAAELNARIRDLWARADGRTLSPAQREEYARLIVQWAAAERRDVVPAA